MREIFVSYSSKHRDLTRELAAVLEAQYGPGSVWWDQELESRSSYATQIRAALEQSRVVVVIWTAGAMVSDYVYAEAQRALETGKLVNVRPRDMSFRDIPEPFNIHHIDEAEDHARILGMVAEVWNGTPIPTRVPLHEIWYRQHGRRLVDPKREPLPANAGPVMLLQAKYALVPYADVTGLAAELVAWCADDPRPTAIRLIHGAGGLGKTRLLIDVAASLRERGWIAGFLERPAGLDEPTGRQRWQAVEQLIDHGSDSGLLLALDYAEGRRDELADLARRLAERPASGARPIRLILLARSAGEWWERLVTQQPELDALADVAPLPTIPEPAQRLALFDAATAAFARHGWARPSVDPPSDLRARVAAADDFERPLAVQMAALLWLAATAPAQGAGGVDKLLDRILGLEHRHWSKLFGTLGNEQIRDLARGVAEVTLVQGVDSLAAAERLLMADGFYGEARRARVAVDPSVRALRALYARADGIGPIEPDLLGEHQVAADRVGDADLVAACLAWIDGQPEPQRPRHRRDLLTVLQRATSPDHGAGSVARAEAMLEVVLAGHVTPFAAELVAVMIETPGSLARLLEGRIGGLDEDALAAIDAQLPLQSLSLMDLALRIADRRAGLARDFVEAIQAAPEPPSDVREAAHAHVAARVGTLGIRLSALGRREKALAASQEAVDHYRQLAAARPDAFLPDLASSLNNLGADLSALGRREEALAASQEAVDHYRQLAAARPDAFLPDLASSLGALSQILAAVDRAADAAAAAAGEGLRLLAPLVERHPQAFAQLAHALAGDLIRHSEAAGIEPDVALLTRIAAALGSGEPDS